MKTRRKMSILFCITLIILTNNLTVETCLESEFECGTGDCVDKTARCDNSFDCPDDTDELNCTVIKPCPEAQYRCANSKCVPTKEQCSDVVECSAGSDKCGSFSTTEIILSITRVFSETSFLPTMLPGTISLITNVPGTTDYLLEQSEWSTAFISTPSLTDKTTLIVTSPITTLSDYQLTQQMSTSTTHSPPSFVLPVKSDVAPSFNSEHQTHILTSLKFIESSTFQDETTAVMSTASFVFETITSSFLIGYSTDIYVSTKPLSFDLTSSEPTSYSYLETMAVESTEEQPGMISTLHVTPEVINSTQQSTLEVPYSTQQSTLDVPHSTQQSTPEVPHSSQQSTQEVPRSTQQSKQEVPHSTQQSTPEVPHSTQQPTPEVPDSSQQSSEVSTSSTTPKLGIIPDDGNEPDVTTIIAIVIAVFVVIIVIAVVAMAYIYRHTFRGGKKKKTLAMKTDMDNIAYSHHPDAPQRLMLKNLSYTKLHDSKLENVQYEINWRKI